MKCCLWPDLVANTPISADMIVEFDDWGIVDNMSPAAKLYSKQADFGASLANLFSKQHNRELPPLTDSMWHPNAADILRSEAEPADQTFKTGPAAKSQAKAKALAKPAAKAKSAPSRPKKHLSSSSRRTEHAKSMMP